MRLSPTTARSAARSRTTTLRRGTTRRPGRDRLRSAIGCGQRTGGTPPSFLSGGTNSRQYWYRRCVSTNLRLGEELAVALREEAARRGRSQQEIVREAIAKELGLTPDVTAMQRAVRAGIVEAPRPFHDVEPTLTLPKGMSSSDLLDREDR